MKTIYNDILKRLQGLIDSETLRWVDFDKGQLKQVGKTERPSVAFPCALIRIGIPSASNITDRIQDCQAVITITLAFDPLNSGRTAANAPEEFREQALEPYDVIAKVYKQLQGYSTDHFSPLARRSQSEVTHNILFAYQIVFGCEFEDETAE